jgi:hypothetical protein
MRTRKEDFHKLVRFCPNPNLCNGMLTPLSRIAQGVHPSCLPGHYPVVSNVTKIAMEDTALPESLEQRRQDGDVPAPKGSLVILDFQGLQMNRACPAYGLDL